MCLFSSSVSHLIIYIVCQKKLSISYRLDRTTIDSQDGWPKEEWQKLTHTISMVGSFSHSIRIWWRTRWNKQKIEAPWSKWTYMYMVNWLLAFSSNVQIRFTCSLMLIDCLINVGNSHWSQWVDYHAFVCVCICRRRLWSITLLITKEETSTHTHGELSYDNTQSNI